MRLARALAHEAAVHKSYTGQLWDILDAASRGAPGYNKEENRDRFQRYISEALNRPNPITIATLFHMALDHGWDGRTASHSATSNFTGPIGDTGPSGASTGTTGASGTSNGPTGPNSGPTQSRAVPVANLPLVPRKREWVHGNDLMRSAVSMLYAPGARAKTTLLLTTALACASGRPLLGAHVFGGRLRVLYVSAEDSTDEIALRLRAAMQHHGLSNADVPGLHVIGQDKWGLSFLRAAAGGAPIIAQDGWDALIAELDHIEPDVLIIDPLINVLGGVDANNNSAAALLIGKFAALAARRRIAVMIAHHVAKGRDPTSAESAMGAASFVNLCRIALGIEPLAEAEAGRIGLPPWEAKSVFRVIGTKQNFSPPEANDRWFRIRSVDIQNQRPPVYPTGDRVAVVEVFQPGSSGPAFPPRLICDALVAVDSASPPLSPSKRSPDRYAAPIIAQAIAAHRGGHATEPEAKSVLDHLVRSELVRVEPIKLSRSGSRADTRKGLVLTAAGKLAIQQAGQFTFTNQTPQSPQTPATTLQDDAGGDPLGPPQRQGGCGGNAGSNSSEGIAPQKE